MTTASRENYLKHVYRRQQSGEAAVSTGQLADDLGVAPASVTGMVKSLLEAGLVEYEPYRGVRLSGPGERIALDVIRRHRLIELLLVEKLGVDWSEVHEDAEALEHAVSDRLLERIDRFLGFPRVDPHGDPIPDARGRLRKRALRTLAEQQAGKRVRVVRVGDQDAPFLKYLDRVGLRPGAEVQVNAIDAPAQVMRLAVEAGEQITLARSAAAKLLVEVV